MTAPTKPEIKLQIDSVAYGAKGVARDNGKVYFVKNAVPGDIVMAAISSDSGRYADATIASLINASPLRGTSPCIYSDSCGGCQWLNIAYAEQCTWKQQFVKSALSRIGKIAQDIQVTMHASPDQLNYRNRIHLKAQQTADNSLAFGYFQEQSHDLVKIERCAIADPKINLFLASLRRLRLDNDMLGTLKIELQVFPAAETPGQSPITALFFPERGNASQQHAAKNLSKQLRSQAQALWVGSITDDDRPILPFEQVGPYLLYSRPGQFQQINLAHNQAMRAAVLAAIERAKPRRILDVCCGSGNFSILAARDGRYIEGVESNPQAIECAHHNVAKNQISGTNYLCGDATRHLWKCARSGELFDLVILDPPREGLYEGMIPLQKIAPETVIYISCDPSTLARDVGSLCRAGYQIESVDAFDFFPNTYHVESLVVLKRQMR